ncbi:HAD-superfamily hydrolase [Salinisphaera dokdonensis CL-ES53]|uniref:HAD-superfamily hydrolase n=1 Tax=Salinisphaera dokdonensis CL-ES53 TaxID=1304272 RepID=A0ABV2B2H2_9GAMM
MKGYELLVFDWDGTLMDSAGEIVSAMQHAIQATGLPERTPEQMRQLIGLGLDDVLARLFPELDTQRVRAKLDAYRARYGMRRSTAILFPPVMAALEMLRDRDYCLAVATGKSRRGLDAAMEDTGTRDFFSFTRCADESLPKPAPAMLEDILLRSATLTEKALMIGDTEYDIAMARAAGVDAIGVGCGVHDAARLRRAGALDVLDTVEALPAWLACEQRSA